MLSDVPEAVTESLSQLPLLDIPTDPMAYTLLSISMTLVYIYITVLISKRRKHNTYI